MSQYITRSDILDWEMLHPRVDLNMLGYIPNWLSENDPRPAKEQLNSGYVYGGWQPFKGFKLSANYKLLYPGDPPIVPLAKAKLREEVIVFYPHSWVGIFQPDNSFEVARLD